MAAAQPRRLVQRRRWHPATTSCCAGSTGCCRVRECERRPKKKVLPPGLTRGSTSLDANGETEDGDGRDKPGHGIGGGSSEPILLDCLLHHCVRCRVCAADAHRYRCPAWIAAEQHRVRGADFGAGGDARDRGIVVIDVASRAAGARLACFFTMEDVVAVARGRALGADLCARGG